MDGCIPSHPWVCFQTYNVVRGAIGPAVSPHTLPNCFKYNGWLESQNRTIVPVILSEAAQHRGRRGLFRHRRIPRRKVLTSWMFAARHEPLQGGPRCSFVLSGRPMVRSVYRELSLRDRLYRAVGFLLALERCAQGRPDVVATGFSKHWTPDVARTNAVATTRPHPQKGRIWL